MVAKKVDQWVAWMVESWAVLRVSQSVEQMAVMKVD
jgi:hypothetical protein